MSSLLDRSFITYISGLYNNISILHRFRDIIDYLPKFKEVT